MDAPNALVLIDAAIEDYNNAIKVLKAQIAGHKDQIRSLRNARTALLSLNDPGKDLHR